MPMAWRRNDSTIMMRVKLVIIISAVGKNDNEVRMSRVSSGNVRSCPPSGSGLLVKPGRLIGSAKATAGSSSASPARARQKFGSLRLGMSAAIASGAGIFIQ